MPGKTKILGPRWRRRDGKGYLSEAQQRRYMSKGLTRAEYESGASLKAARGHATTPEHGIEEARKNPRKYQEYLNKQEKPGKGGTIHYTRDQLVDLAQRNSYRHLGDYFKYNQQRAFKRIAGMTERQLRVTIGAGESELVQLASPQYNTNPWYYH